MTNDIVRPITMTEGFLVFKFTLNYFGNRFKHLAIFTKGGKLVIREEWFRS